jgi:hypothetical protein
MSQPPVSPDRPTFAAGPVTLSRIPETAPAQPTPSQWPAPDIITSDRPRRPPNQRRDLFIFGGIAGGVLVVGLVVLLVLVLNGEWGTGKGPLSHNAAAPPDFRPPLAKLCPAPTAPPPVGAAAPAATGNRTVDEKAGISYNAYGPPWKPWPFLWRLGTLQVPYGVGQHFVTETYVAGDYHASVLSAAVPATVNDSTLIDIECVGQQVAADVRAEYYPQPNTMDLMTAGKTTLDGHPAWVTKFRLHFNETGLRAKSELVGVALVDVGKPTAAVLYVSIPDTNREWDYVVDDAINSLRVLS